MRFKDRLGRGTTVAIAMAYGAGMMYVLDPDRGAARRAWVRDKLARMRHDARRWASRQMRDSLHRARGTMAEARARMREQQVDDDVLEQRVRAQLGHVVSHPGMIEVGCRNGNVTLRGVVLPGERERIDKRLASTRGVRQCALELRTVDDISAAAGRQVQYQQRAS